MRWHMAVLPTHTGGVAVAATVVRVAVGATAVLVLVALGGTTTVLVRVALGGTLVAEGGTTTVLVRVAVGGTGVAVRVAVLVAAGTVTVGHTPPPRPVMVRV